MNYIEDVIKYLSDNLLTLGPFVGMLICIVESLVPILPLALFIGLNIKTFGIITGFLISYIGCIIGSILTYFLSKKLTNEFIESKLEIVKKINEFTKLSKERELTEEEKKEREKYRILYIDKFKESLKGHLDNIKIVKVDDEGNPVDDDGNIIPAEA